jgi:hypothetical protein
MLKQASWTHGNSVVVEQPENLSSIQRSGWGTDLLFIPGGASWCHIPIPTPVIMNDQRANVQNLFLLFECSTEGSIRQVHIWDGSILVQQFNDINLEGDHTGVDASSTFTLGSPHQVSFGMSISFRFQASPDNTAPTLLKITSAGADFI